MRNRENETGTGVKRNKKKESQRPKPKKKKYYCHERVEFMMSLTIHKTFQQFGQSGAMLTKQRIANDKINSKYSE